MFFGSALVLQEYVLVAVDRRLDDLERLVSAVNLEHLHRLAFKLFVYAEEVLDLRDDVRRQIGDVLITVPGRLLERHRNHLDVLRSVVDHRDVPYRITTHQRHTADRLAAQYQYVERISVVRVRARDETVVRGIVRGRVQYSVQYQHARLLVDFVLVFASLRDLDDADEIFGRDPLGIDIVPDIHIFSSLTLSNCAETPRS